MDGSNWLVATGSVTDGIGSPVAGVTVWAYKTTDTYVGSYKAVTAPVGSYTLAGLPAGSYQLRFAPTGGSGLKAEWYDDAPTRTTAALVAVVGGATSTNYNASLAAL